VSSSAVARWRKLSPYVDRLVELGGEVFCRLYDELRAQDSGLAHELQRIHASYERLQAENFLDADSPATPDPLLLTGKTVGAYTLEALLGHGGMGSVWLARRSDGRFEGKVAIKLLNAFLVGRHGEECFRSEGHVLAKLEHPNIARLRDAGVSDTGQPFLVLEYVYGRPIDEYCDDRKLDINARLELFLDVLAATAHAHSQLVIHRDLKPANIFVTADGVVKLLDFGIAKLIDASEEARQSTTRVGHSPFTLHYASPEQINGTALGTASDVYSLGVLLYELLTGTRPYRPARESPGAMEEAILTALPMPPSRAINDEEAAQNRRATTKKLAKVLRNDLDAIVLTALKKEPSARYATAAAFAKDLKHYLRAEPIVARGDDSWHRIERFVARNKLPVAASATAVLALIVGLWMSLWQAHLAREQATRAEEIRRFIESVFQQANPIVSGSAEVRAVDWLLRGRERVEQQLRGYGSLQTELMCTIASSLFGLNAYAESRNTFERALALAESSRANLARTIPACLIDYADLLSIVGDYAQADATLKTLEREPRGDAMGLIAGRTRQIRAVLDLEFGRTAEALRGIHEAAAIIRRIAPSGSRVSLDAMLNLARVQFHAEQNTAALTTVDTALEEISANPQEAQMVQGITLLLKALRARALSAIGRRDEAAQHYASLLPLFASVFGTNTQLYAVNVYEYSVIERRRGELQHAILLGEEAVTLAKTSGSSKSHLAIVAGGLATTLLLANRPAAARVQALQAEKLFGEVFGLDTEDGMRFQATAIYASGLTEQPLEAASKLERIVELQRADGSVYTGVTLRFLGDLYLRAARYHEATVALREAEAAVVSSADQSTLLPVIRAHLGLALLGLGKYEEAAHEFQAAISAEGVTHTLTPAQADAHLGLARVFLARNDPATALVHAAKADHFWRDFDPANPTKRDATRWRERAQRAAARVR
jgi:serine/threonine protein kinase